MEAAVAKPERQPKGLYLLSGVEMWERFSFYGMRAFLVLYLTSATGEFGWTNAQASQLYGWYTGLVYMTGLLGGFMADMVLGNHRALIVGSFLIAAGHFALAVPGKTFFFLGLALIILGTGFHKPIISTMVGQVYKPGDPRRDGGFTIYYMGINLGALLGPLICGGFAESQRFGWHWGFACAGVGMVLGTVVYLLYKRRYLGTIGDVPAMRQKAGATAAPPLTRQDWAPIAAIAIFAFFNIFFWSAYEQAGSSMNFFVKERTDRWFFGWEMPTSWFQSVNSATILICAPGFAWLWMRLASRGREPSTPMKFAWGLLLVSLGFIVMVLGARLSDGGAKVSPFFFVAATVLHTWGELCVSPVGLSMVTKLAPVKLGSLLMGVWWFSFFVSDLLAGTLAAQVTKIEKGHVFTLLGGQADFFLIFVIAPALAAVLMALISGKVKRLMHGRA